MTHDSTVRIESKGGFELSLEITVGALLAGLYDLRNAHELAVATCGNFPLQALEVVNKLSQLIFHRL